MSIDADSLVRLTEELAHTRSQDEKRRREQSDQRALANVDFDHERCKKSMEETIRAFSDG